MNIYKELGDWYLGCATKDKGSRGIFPKNYIKIKNQKEKQQPIIQEITTVVREWGTILKDLYIVRCLFYKWKLFFNFLGLY